MADDLGFTPGAGATIAADDVGGVHYQRIKIDGGGDGLTEAIGGTAANGLDVDVTRVQGVVSIDDNAGSITVDDGGSPISVDDNAGSITVDAPVATPVAVRVSDGAAFIAPALEHATAASPHAARLSDGAAFYDAAKTGQLPAALVSGRLDVNIGAIGATVSIDDAAGTITVDDGGVTLSVDDGGGALTIDGTVTANQGTAAVVANAWPVKVSDGTDTVGITDVSGAKAMKVDVVQSVEGSTQVDKTAFSEGAGNITVIGGTLNDTPVGDPADNQASVCRITAKRALHVNLRDDSGGELGVVATPVRVDPTGTTTQPVNVSQFGGSAVVAAAAGIPKVGLTDEAGATFSETNAVPVRCTNLEKTPVRKSVTFSASQTAITVWDPTAGKKFVVESIILSVTAAGTIHLFDETDAVANYLSYHTGVVGDQIQLIWPNGHPSSTADNILKYTTGAGAAGQLTVFGYETD
jgi:hypothetical protein